MNVFSQLNHSHMAVALAEKEKSDCSLWLFRNEHRPLWIVDLRNLLGQVFFVSEKKIWEEAVEDVDLNIFKYHKVMELPPYQIWLFRQKLQLEFQKYSVIKTAFKEIEFDGYKIPILKNKSAFEVITDLAADESVEKSITYHEIIDRLTNLNDFSKMNKIMEVIKDNKLL